MADNELFLQSAAVTATISSHAGSRQTRNEILGEDGMSGFVESEMECLYQSYFSCFARFRVYGSGAGIRVFTIRENQRLLSILAYRQSQNGVIVLNEQIEPCAWELNAFAQHMFAHCKKLGVIHFKAVKTDVKQLVLPHHRVYFTNDIVVRLPASEAAYQKMLGKSTRENINRSLRMLKRDFPDFSCEVHEKREGNREIFNRIIELNCKRMALKDKAPGIDAAEADRLWQLVQTHGFIVSVSIGKKVCAGAICYRVGENYFMRVIAHDSAFDDHSLGLLTSYLTIRECISRGGSEFHFLWGNEAYKRRLGGKARDYDSITIYRSKLIFLLNIVPILTSTLQMHLREMRIWASDPENSKRAIPRFAMQLRKIWRTIRH